MIKNNIPVPDGYRWMKPGETITKDTLYYLDGDFTYCADDIGQVYDGINYWISRVIKIKDKKPEKIIPNKPNKFYTLKLTKHQVAILWHIMNNLDKVLLPLVKNEKLTEIAQSEFDKAGTSESCIWNKLDVIKEQIRAEDN